LIIDRNELTAMFSLVWTPALEKRLPGHSKVRKLAPFLPPAAQDDADVLKLGIDLPDGRRLTNLDEPRLMSVHMQSSNARFCQLAARLTGVHGARLRLAFEWEAAEFKFRVISVVQ
jgi:hypothetical protein